MPPLGTLRKIDLNITNDCNLRCRHCCFRSGEGDLGMCSFDQLERFLTDARKVGAHRIDITGGEALTRPDIFDIIAMAKGLGYRIELLSNGIGMTEGVIERLRGIGLDAVGISLESLDYEVNRRIRPTSRRDFEGILAHVEDCVAAGFYTKLNSVVFQANYRGFADLARWCESHGLAEYGIYYLTPIGRGDAIQEEVVDPRLWLAYVRDALHPIGEGYKVSIEVAWLEPEVAEDLEVSCFIKRPHHIQILPTGNIYPCAIMSVWNRPLGNIKEESIIDIWTDDARWERYDGIIDGLFAAYRGCVDYGPCGYDTGGYAFVCPCSKYSTRELALPREGAAAP